MSADLRLKKLRGSGGYVMASVNDDQQRKGNLGGPDLFLAPIGRLESSKISKYFCNTCEKDYEGSPKIEYENPNEEVADNLILMEKGQYVCTTCGSTLAEYREFRKPDELGEAGLAKPVEEISSSSLGQSTQTFEEPQDIRTEPTFPEEIPVIEPTNIPTTDIQGNLTPPQPEVTTQFQSPSSSSISSIVGMSVFDEGAKKIGTAKQVGVNPQQELVLVITRNDGTEMSVPWTQINKVGDIVLLGSQPSFSPASQIPPSSSGNCSSCGFSNKDGSKFCEQCGARI